MRRARLRPALALVLIAGGVLSASASAYTPTDVKEVVLTVRHSRFSTSHLEVERGQRVRFVVRNTDPIDHELIVGSMAVQDRHEMGSEPHHAPRDGEVSVPLLETASTHYTFDRKGTFFFGCHLPGHWDYGMKGHVVVR